MCGGTALLWNPLGARNRPGRGTWPERHPPPGHRRHGCVAFVMVKGRRGFAGDLSQRWACLEEPTGLWHHNIPPVQQGSGATDAALTLHKSCRLSPRVARSKRVGKFQPHGLSPDAHFLGLSRSLRMFLGSCLPASAGLGGPGGSQ